MSTERPQKWVGAAVVRTLRAIGCHHVVIDLQDYRLGSFNDSVRLRSVGRA